MRLAELAPEPSVCLRGEGVTEARADGTCRSRHEGRPALATRDCRVNGQRRERVEEEQAKDHSRTQQRG